ncbi:unnamed protein product [Musa textilis]
MTGLHGWWIGVLNPINLHINMICLLDLILKLILRHSLLIHRILLVHQCSDDRRLIVINHICPRWLLRHILVNVRASTIATDLLLYIILLPEKYDQLSSYSCWPYDSP